MKNMIMLFIVIGVSIPFLNGCMQTNNNYALKQDDVIQYSKKNILLTSSGHTKTEKNLYIEDEAMLMAKRSAMAKAYNALGEKLYAVELANDKTIKDMILGNIKKQSILDKSLQDVDITHNEFKDGIYYIAMELRVDKESWLDKLAR